MNQELEAMWARKLGLAHPDMALVNELLGLMLRSRADVTILFRRLCDLPEHPSALEGAFYAPMPGQLEAPWSEWLRRWHDQLAAHGDLEETSAAMKRTNPAITWREWLVAPAYQQAEQGDHSLIAELQAVFSNPYESLPAELATKYDRLRPAEFFGAGGVSHYSCSS
jgi:uncharacterized protein YdiU (UPF0061 family)